MRKTFFVLTFVAFTVAIGAARRFRVEYHDPVRGSGGVYTLDVIFSYRASASEAERIIRGEVEHAVTRHPPRGDVLASGWYSPTGAEIDEDLIVLPDGSSHLIFLRKLKKTITFNEYERRKPAR
jgi:hypothetical protein